MKLVNFFRRRALGTEGKDFLTTSIDFDADTKRIVRFCVVQLHQYKEQLFEIVKYDSAHGFCHVLDNKGQKLLDNQINEKSLLEFKNDIRQNWQEYRNIYLRKWLKQKV
jgi:hypothetical protein